MHSARTRTPPWSTSMSYATSVVRQSAGRRDRTANCTCPPSGEVRRSHRWSSQRRLASAVIRTGRGCRAPPPFGPTSLWRSARPGTQSRSRSSSRPRRADICPHWSPRGRQSRTSRSRWLSRWPRSSSVRTVFRSSLSERTATGKVTLVKGFKPATSLWVTGPWRRAVSVWSGGAGFVPQGRRSLRPRSSTSRRFRSATRAATSASGTRPTCTGRCSTRTLQGLWSTLRTPAR
mmetsp:Transcript_19353/g.58206  ORF Transcript_19353/g.58206 Transcript_19353/m.58206 type:complete len:233 (-) Transcript_19353:858-1556(-)